MKFTLKSYLKRVTGSSARPQATMATLCALMKAQMGAVSFENIDVVLGRTISMEASEVASKLVGTKRGGYCFEQNTLLQSALEEIGFTCTPLLCRVRWGKPEDTQSMYTHMCLKVEGGDLDGSYLADVGFAGTNSLQPIKMDVDEKKKVSSVQTKVDGVYRIEEKDSYYWLQVQDRENLKIWRSLYCWPVGDCFQYPDIVAANWISCTFPSSRFTNQFFVARTVGVEKLHILNDDFVRRTIEGELKEQIKIKDVKQLVTLLRETFDIEIEEQAELGKYLTSGQPVEKKKRKEVTK